MSRLTRKEISQLTGMTESMIGRFLEIPEVRDLMGPEGARATYPPESLPLFQKLHDLRLAKHIKPGTNPQTIVMLLQEQDDENQKPVSAPQTLVPSAQVQAGSPGFDAHQFAALVASAVQAGVAQALETDRQQHARDEFLTRQEAASALKCHVGSIRRLTGIVPIRRGVYLRSDIDQYIARLKAQRADQQRAAAPALPPAPDDPPASTE